MLPRACWKIRFPTRSSYAHIYRAIARSVNAFLVPASSEDSFGSACFFERRNHAPPQILFEFGFDLPLEPLISFRICFFGDKYGVPRIPALLSYLAPSYPSSSDSESLESTERPPLIPSSLRPGFLALSCLEFKLCPGKENICNLIAWPYAIEPLGSYEDQGHTQSNCNCRISRPDTGLL